MNKKPILWRHQLWIHINKIWEFKSDKFFNFCLNSIPSQYHILRLDTLEGFKALIGHRWLVTMETQFKIFLESSIIACISFGNIHLKETKL